MQSVMRSMRSEIFWGVAALVIVTIVSLCVASLYVNPPKQQIVTFYTDDAMSVHQGDTVRIAGIVVGKVKDLSIEPDRIRVRASVDRDAFVGDQSQVEVRMLTVVGGYYVSIIPLGGSPLGGASAIPAERVTMPYSLIRTLADTSKIVEHIAPKPISESIDQLQRGLTGTNVDAITELVKAGNSTVETFERQRGQLSSILDLSDEYIQRLSNDRGVLEDVISKTALLEETLILYGKQFGKTLLGLGDVGHRLDSVVYFYMSHRSDFLARVRGILEEFHTIADRNGLVVRVLNRIRQRMERALEAQNNATPPQLLATDLCIPIEGSPC